MTAGDLGADSLASQIAQAANLVRGQGTTPVAALAETQMIARIRTLDSTFFTRFAEHPEWQCEPGSHGHPRNHGEILDSGQECPSDRPARVREGTWGR